MTLDDLNDTDLLLLTASLSGKVVFTTPQVFSHSPLGDDLALLDRVDSDTQLRVLRERKPFPSLLTVSPPFGVDGFEGHTYRHVIPTLELASYQDSLETWFSLRFPVKSNGHRWTDLADPVWTQFVAVWPNIWCRYFGQFLHFSWAFRYLRSYPKVDAGPT